jgi:hypothetical protein
MAVPLPCASLSFLWRCKPAQPWAEPRSGRVHVRAVHVRAGSPDPALRPDRRFPAPAKRRAAVERRRTVGRACPNGAASPLFLHYWWTAHAPIDLAVEKSRKLPRLFLDPRRPRDFSRFLDSLSNHPRGYHAIESAPLATTALPPSQRVVVASPADTSWSFPSQPADSLCAVTARGIY